jgi:hypothetical protein
MVLRPPDGVIALPRAWIVLAWAGISLPPSIAAQIEGSLQGLTYNFDLREAPTTGKGLGLDFDVRYERERTSRDGNPQGNQYGLSIKATGFQTFDSKTADVNSMAGELAVRGRYYRSGLTVLPAWQQTRYLRLAECDPAAREPEDSAATQSGCTGFTKAEEEEYNRLVSRIGQQRRFFSYDLHYRYETTQDFSFGQHAFGAGISGEVPLLAELLDAIPAMTRRDSSGFRARDVRAYAGVDRLDPDKDIPLYAGSAAPLWRARWEMAWSTQVFDELVLRALWQGEYLFDAPAPVKAADRTFNAFLQAWMIYPISAKTGVLIKYVTGYMPPTYDESTVGSVGFSFTLQ